MPWWAWVCLGIFGALVLAGSAVLVAAFVSLVRASSRFNRSLEPALADMERSGAALQQAAATLTADQERFRRSQASATASYNGLMVLWAALGEVRTGLRLLRFVLARR